MVEGLGFILLTALLAIGVTALAARRVVRRNRHASATSQVMRSGCAFPVLALLLFAAVVAFTLAGGGGGSEPGTTGMVVFAMTFFLVYALAIGAVVGIPTAILMVRRLRAGSSTRGPRD